jgi:Cd2+/Zn2+-exporting ATPase
MGHKELPAAPACTGCAGDAPEARAQAEVVYRIDNMDCPTEESLIRSKLSGMPGIESLGFNLMGRTLTVVHTLDAPEAIERALSAIGMNAKRVGAPAGSGVPAAVVARYRIQNMDCPTEEILIRRKLIGMQGVKALEFNLMQRTLAVTHELPSTEPVEKALADIGMNAEPLAQSAGTTKTVLAIPKMDCPTEEGLIRAKLKGMQGIDALEFNLVQRSLTLTHEPAALQTALAALNEIGMPAEAPAAALGKEEKEEPERTNWWPLAVSGIAATVAEIVEWNVGGFHWATVALALLAIFTGGLPTYKKGWIALRNGNLNMNSLMSIAVTGAMVIGYWPEAAMVMFLFAIAEVIEAKSLDRARRAIRDLMDLAPDTATVRQADGSWAEVDAKQVQVGAVARTRPGERLALDGVLLSGNSTVDQAPITGESLPVEKATGDPVFAGTINQAGSFEYRVSALASNSTLARIIHAVEAAQGSRAPTQRFVDQFSRIYTPVVFAVAIGFALVPPLLFGGAWLDWIYRALVLLVIACPCALVISTPVTIVSGLAAAARKGILIKGGAYLEEARHLSVLALDKTGTLTYGKPAQTDFRLLAGNDEATARSLASSLAARSDHPVSTAIAKAAAEAGFAAREVGDFKALPGRGVEGRIDGKEYRLGNHRLMQDLGLASGEIEQAREEYERQGKTVVYLADESRVLCFFAVADTVRDSSRQAIAELHALGVKTVLLTGDNAHTAIAIAHQVGIDEARGDLLPEDKLRIIEELQSKHGKVGMIGDGINDAPALARADVGIAMGAAGTDTAIETADVALMDDDLRKVSGFLHLSRRTAAILKQNIALALGIKAVFIVLTVAGSATMWMAVFADMGASLLVVFNGLRLLRK